MISLLKINEENVSVSPNLADNLLSLGLIFISTSNFISGHDFFLVIFLAYTFYIYIRRKITLDVTFFFLFTFYILWIVAITLKFNNFYLVTYAGFLIRIFYAYLTVKCLNEKFVPLLVRNVYYLSLISIPLFIIQLTLPGPFFKINNFLPALSSFFQTSKGVSNSLLFTFSSTHLGRNSGFMWEPGAFAGVIITTILIYLPFNKMKLNKIFFILLLALLTTLSTTGYISIAFIVLLVIVNTNIKYRILYILIALPMAIYIYNLEFITEKIKEEIEESVNEFGKSSDEQGGTSTSRFTSLLKDWQDIKKNYIIGVGISDETRYASDKFDKTLRSNGTSDWVVKFGFLGFLVLIINYFLSFKKLLQTFNLSGAWIMVLAILVISFSEAFLYLPLFLSLQFIQFIDFEHKVEIREESQQLITSNQT